MGKHTSIDFTGIGAIDDREMASEYWGDRRAVQPLLRVVGESVRYFKMLADPVPSPIPLGCCGP
jgi:hypothetical protein